MKFTNLSQYDTQEVRELVETATKGIKLRKVKVTVTNTKHTYAGRAWDSWPYRRMLIRIGSPDQFPITCKYPRKKTAPTYEMRDWREGIVAVAAHEARHIYQYKFNKRRSEIDAERWAVKKLEEYRVKRLQTV